MADTNKTGTQTPTNQTLNQEHAKAEVSGGKQAEKGQDKSAIGMGDQSKTGEQGRARNELDQNQGRSEFDKNRTEPAGSGNQR